jgi:glutamyl-tRNA reductase
MNAQPNHPVAGAAEIGDARSEAEVEELWQWGEGLAALSVIAQFREELNRVRERELAVALKRLPDLTPAQRATMERLSQALMNEFMHEPSVRLGAAAAANGRGLGIVDAARYLFALDDARTPAGSERGDDVRAA